MDGKQRYEFHTYQDPDFPFIFHEDCLSFADKLGIADFHWHEHLELLCLTDGAAPVWINAETIAAQAGHVVVVNSNNLHAVLQPEEYVKYYCLIINKGFCEAFGFDPEQTAFVQRISDPALSEHFVRIAAELKQAQPHYKAAVKGEILLLLTRLFRLHRDDAAIPKTGDGKSELTIVRAAIAYMRRTYETPVSTADIAAGIGFSPSYLCRVFRHVTGYTVMRYLTLLRCMHAQRLLRTGMSVEQTAQRCGFESASYFAQVYKRCMGRLPSKERQEAAREPSERTDSVKTPTSADATASHIKP